MENEIVKETYHQMTIDEWVEIKNELQRELQNVAESFVRIGYQLRKIRDGKLYEQDGYKTISEFAQKEYGLSPSVTSRFMAINERYSVDGYSKYLMPEYMGYGQSKLTEMLALPETDMAMVTPEMQRADIRELKEFNREEPAEGIADDRYQLFEAFYEANPDIVRDLYGDRRTCADPERVKEIINPSGSRTFRKGLFFVSFTEADIKIKKFGGQPETLTYEDLRDITEAVFAWDADGTRTYDNHFGKGEEEKEKADDNTRGAEGEAGCEQGSGDGETGGDESISPGEGENQGSTAGTAGLSAGAGGDDPGEKDDRSGTEESAEAAGQEPPDGIAPAQMEAEKKGEPEELAGAMNPPEEAESEETEAEAIEAESQVEAVEDSGGDQAPEAELYQTQDQSAKIEDLGYRISKRLTKIRKLADEKRFDKACTETAYLLNLLREARELQKQQ